MKTLAALVLCLSLAACSGLVSKAAPERRFFLVQADHPARTAGAAPEAVLKIKDFRVSPGFEDRPLVYRTGDSTWVSDFYNAFFVDPSAMLAGQTRQWLAETGLYGRVTDLASRLPATRYLEGSLTTLHGDFRDPAAPRAVMELQFLLLSGEAAPRPLLLKTYRREIPLPNRAPEALTKGYDAALTEILHALTADLAAVP